MEGFKNQKCRDEVLKSYDRLLKMWAVEYSEKDIKTSFGITHCIITGEATNPPLILFHGVGDNSAVMWAPNIKELSTHFYCIAIDTLGGPGKSIPNEMYTKENFSQQAWINEIVDELHLDTFHIAGVSNGAAMVYNYVTKERDRIGKAVCIEGGIVTDPLKSMIRTLGMMFPEILFPTNNNLLKVLTKLTSPNSGFLERYPEIAQHLVLLMKSHNRKAMFVHTIEKYDKVMGLKVKDKLYFLLGGHMVGKRSDVIEVLNEGAYKYRIVPDAGHALNHEQPEITNKEITNFLLS
ncbi:MAG TPA: alpha/beta hydrolase [Lachnospiraceae bacterium]|nr:alpha/beta hydrolase [Lachnospiraceae bacterium]